MSQDIANTPRSFGDYRRIGGAEGVGGSSTRLHDFSSGPRREYGRINHRFTTMHRRIHVQADTENCDLRSGSMGPGRRGRDRTDAPPGRDPPLPLQRRGECPELQARRPRAKWIIDAHHGKPGGTHARLPAGSIPRCRSSPRATTNPDRGSANYGGIVIGRHSTSRWGRGGVGVSRETKRSQSDESRHTDREKDGAPGDESGSPAYVMLVWISP